MTLRSIVSSLILLSSITLTAQYGFEKIKTIESTEIKNQCNTGTCWSFATTSFIESELARMGKGQVDLSEMYTVRKIYEDKALNYVLRQGKANFSEGSLSHDMIRVLADHGIMPEAAYSGLVDGEERYDHSEMSAGLKGFLDGVMSGRRPTKRWDDAFSAILDVYMGEAPSTFEVKGKTTDPVSYASSLGLDADDYVSITSFTHHPYGESFILEIPDNYSNGQFINVELDRMIGAIDKALAEGFSIAWDGDVSEKGFSDSKGIAVLPVDATREDLFETPGEELKVTAASRQDDFMNYTTTDDHLMHLIGVSRDKEGNKYYVIKNSWGTNSPYDGYIHMSEAYLRAKTVSVMMHRDALAKDILGMK